MRTLIVSVLLLVLTGCGSSGGSDTESAEAFGQTYPSCSKTWVAGETLPEDYEGCATDPDNIEAGVSIECADGFDIFTYEPKGGGFWTDATGEIVDGGADCANTPAYGKRFDECNK